MVRTMTGMNRGRKLRVRGASSSRRGAIPASFRDAVRLLCVGLLSLGGFVALGGSWKLHADARHSPLVGTEPVQDPRLPDEHIIVKGQRRGDRAIGAEATGKVESLHADEIRRYGSQSLADAIKRSRGVDTQTFCANCGAKRVTINGLRGEHTTILVDGVPLHSAVSAFYGVDAVPVVGLERIEVRRGAGSALTAPEAVGGVIDLITIEPQGNRLDVSYEQSDRGAFQKTALAQAASASSGAVLALQEGQLQAWDRDGNGIAESPFRATRSGMLKLRQRWGEDHDLSLRLSAADLDIIGGNPNRKRPQRYTPIQAQPSDFVDTDVRQPYIGQWERITDSVQLNRQESVAQYTGRLPRDREWDLRVSRVQQRLTALYSHGFDYANRDTIDGVAAHYRTLIGDGAHLVSFGWEERHQAMNSQSQALFVDREPPLVPDRLRFESRAFTLLDEYRPMHQALRIDFALRYEDLDIRWVDLKTSIDDQLLLPRIDVRYDHTGHLSSRLSYGRGYRPPLTLFESEHGSDHNGFVLAIDHIEKADSLVYSFSANYPNWFVTLSSHATRLQHMAYADSKVPKGQPLIFRNSPEPYDVFAHDIFVGGNLLPQLFWQASYEHFHYPDQYTRKLPTAAIEQRWRLEAAYDSPEWALSLQATRIGARQLTRYGYDAHFNRYDLDVTSPSFGQVSEQKPQYAPAFWDLAVSGRWQLNPHYALTARVNNLLDYTQIGAGDSPATWHWHVNHAHYDNFHIWGPLTGREYFVGLMGQW